MFLYKNFNKFNNCASILTVWFCFYINSEFVCKYKESHGCGFVSTSESEASRHTMIHSCKYSESHGCRVFNRNESEALNHEKSHWEVKPWKCNHCSYQGELKL